jgi:hypothetical protein
MADRTTFSELSTPPVAGDDFLEQYSARLKQLFDASALPLTSVGGTGDAVTASLDPVLDGGGLVDGMKFTVTWAAANTAGVTLAINGGSAVPVLDAEGTALLPDALATGLRSVIEYVGGDFRILTAVLGTTDQRNFYFLFTSSGTFNLPAGLDDDRMVHVELWAAGGGGARGSASQGGGGGGGYLRASFRAVDVPSTVAVTVGAGGIGRTATTGVGTAGGASSFGALLSAAGGQGGDGSDGGSGGGTSGGVSGTPFAGYGDSGASGGYGGSGGSTSHGGGGGGGGASGSGTNGGTSLWGGNGGGGGDGTPAAVAGTAPGGGGGGANLADGANGARGEVRVWI